MSIAVSPRIPAGLRHLVDDAAVFPPGQAPLHRAVAEHAEHLASDHRELVGPFVIGAGRLGELAALADAVRFPPGLRVSVVVPTPAAVSPVVDAVDATDRLVLAALEVKLGTDRPPAAHVAEVAAAMADLPRVPTFVEVPRNGATTWVVVADAVATHGLRLKFRTGGTESGAFPSEAELAGWIHGAASRRTPFKCTAGLHRAVRHTDAATGFEHHGYLNVLLATVVAARGATVEQVAATLAERDPTALARAIASAGDASLARARAAFTSYGSCSILEPLADLEALRLLGPTPARTGDPR